MIIHSSNSSHAHPGARVEIPSTPSAAILLKSGVVDKHFGRPHSSHITFSRWVTPVFDGGRQIVAVEITGKLCLPFGKEYMLPTLSFSYKLKHKALTASRIKTTKLLS